MKTISVIVKEEVFLKLKELAKEDSRSVSNLISILIDKEITKRK